MNSRSALLKSMSKLLIHTSIDKLTVQMILDDAGVSRGTFYSYFADKYDLMNAYFRDQTAKHMANIDNAPWVEMLTKGAEFLRMHRAYFLRAFQSTGQNSFTEFWLQNSWNNIAKGIKRHSGRNQLSLKERRAIRFFAAGYVQTMTDWLQEDGQESPKQIAQLICSFIPPIIKPYMW